MSKNFKEFDKNFKGFSIFSSNKKIKKDVKNVLRVIKKCGAILPTGHISWRESQALVNVVVQEIGLKKIIVTHPIYKKIAMPLGTQKKLAESGAFIEHCFSMYSIDNISVKKIAGQIKSVDAERCILSFRCQADFQ